MVTWKSDRTSSRNASNSSSARSTSSMSSTGAWSSRVIAFRSGRLSRYGSEDFRFLLPNVVLFTNRLFQADVQHLLGIVPLVQRTVGIQAFVALQSDQV